MTSATKPGRADILPGGDMMLKIVVDSGLCRGSGECVRVCPEQAISLIDGTAVVDPLRCVSDGLCIPACPHQAIDYEDPYTGGCGF